MTRFLWMFQSYRDLAFANTKLGDELVLLRGQCDRLQRNLDRSREDAILCREKVADTMAVLSRVGPIFGKLSDYPDARPAGHEPVQRVELAADEMARMEQQFDSDLSAYMAQKVSE
jgi:hypothetical protein